MKTSRLDRFAIFCSSVCIVHCLASSLAILFIPFLSRMITHSEYFHFVMLLFVLPLAIISPWNGTKQHKQYHILFLSGLGMILMTGGAFAVPLLGNEQWDTPLSVFGSICLIVAHYRNMKHLCQIQRTPRTA